MKQNHNYLKMLLSGLCFVIFLFLAVASVDEKSGGSGGSDGYTPTRIEENPETDFSSDISEDEREDEEEYVSQTDDDEEEFVSQTVDEDESEPSGSAVQEFPDTIS